jgi:hypothetical protein
MIWKDLIDLCEKEKQILEHGKIWRSQKKFTYKSKAQAIKERSTPQRTKIKKLRKFEEKERKRNIEGEGESGEKGERSSHKSPLILSSPPVSSIFSGEKLRHPQLTDSNFFSIQLFILSFFF